jgi:DNA-binding response OmpR family regulator
MKVLVIDDSERLRRALSAGLHRSGFAVDLAGDGGEGLNLARIGSYDVIVLDLMLPRMDGITVLRRLRAEGCGVHVLILSARDQVAQRIEGLQAGADDYLVKPFDFDELVARLRALVRRKYGSKDPMHRVGQLAVDTAKRTLARGEVQANLTRTEFALLEYLLTRRGRVVSKRELLDHLYTGGESGSDNGLEVLVHQLRRKARELGCHELVKTCRGHGYLVE